VRHNTEDHHIEIYHFKYFIVLAANDFCSYRKIPLA